MEVLSPFEVLDEGDWISPRISFSQDFQPPDRFSPKTQFKDSPEEEFSFNFRNSISMDLPTEDSMLSADELFFNGKLRPLQKALKMDSEKAAFMKCGGKRNELTASFDEQKSQGMASARIADNPRCFSMTIENCRGDVHGNRACMSLTNSRCCSPSRTMSMPHTTPTSPKASSLPSSSAMRSSLMSSAASTSSSAATSTSKYSSKFKEFFKLKKMNMGKDVHIPPLPSSSVSAEIARECPQSSVSASCRLPSSRSFWPFSRSNSAGESKTTPAVSPPPRRSNSAGEGKTTSSSLMPVHVLVSAKELAEHSNKDSLCSIAASTNLSSKGSSSFASPDVGVPLPIDLDVSVNPSTSVKCFPPSAMAKKGLPPLPNPSVRKTSSFFVPAHCVADAVTLSTQSSQSSSMPACVSWHKIADIGAGGSKSVSRVESMPSSSCSAGAAETSSLCPGMVHGFMRENTMQQDTRNPGCNAQHMPDVKHTAHKGTSPGRSIRRSSNGNLSRNFARGSPGRRGAWNSPGRGNAGRVIIRNLDRGNTASKGHVRPKDMLSRDGPSVRISPLLNVAVPSLRGTSKSKIFSLGNLFSKKERIAGGYNLLPSTDSQNGG